MAKKKKKKNKNKGVYCPNNSIPKKKDKIKGMLTPLEFKILCNKLKIGNNKVEIFNWF